MFLRNIVVFTLLSFGTTAMADTFDINLRNSSAQVQYRTPMGKDSLGKTELHLGALYADSNNSNNTLADLGILVKDEVGEKAPGFSLGVGVKGLLSHTQGTDESCVALGGLIRYSPPGLTRMGIVGQLYFAPDITTFGDANRYGETGVWIEYEVIPKAAAYVGYRNIQFNLNSGSQVRVDEGGFIGVRMSF